MSPSRLALRIAGAQVRPRPALAFNGHVMGRLARRNSTATAPNVDQQNAPGLEQSPIRKMFYDAKEPRSLPKRLIKEQCAPHFASVSLQSPAVHSHREGSDASVSVTSLVFKPWENSRSYHLPLRYLRDMCACEVCRDPHSRQKNIDTVSISTRDDHLAVAGITTENCPPGFFDIHWSNDPATRSEKTQNLPIKHVTRLSFEVIRNHLKLVPPPETLSSNHTVLWFGNEYENEAATGSVWFNFDDLIRQDETAYDSMLEMLQKFGLVFVRNMPDSETAVEQLAETIGPIRNTFYGRTWDVKDKPNAENVAYTSGYLDLHADLLYMKQPPGFQLLHCLRESAEGGESIFADTFRVARNLWRRRRRAFLALCDFPVTYAYEHGDKNNYYVDSKPVFEVDHLQIRESQGGAGQLNNSPLYMTPIANTNWSPMFQATSAFAVEGAWKDYGHQFLEWYDAARHFYEFLKAPNMEYKYKLKPGECVIFNNRRVLHGRERFTSQPGSGERWLKGTYLDSDDFMSKYRSMQLRKLEKARAAAGSDFIEPKRSPENWGLRRHQTK